MGSTGSLISTRCILKWPMMHATFFPPVDELRSPLLCSLANIHSKMSLQWVVCQRCELWRTKPKRLMKKHGLHSSIHPLSLHPACLPLLYLFCLTTLNEYGSNFWHHCVWSTPVMSCSGNAEREFQWKRDAQCSGEAWENISMKSDLGGIYGWEKCSKVEERWKWYLYYFKHMHLSWLIMQSWVGICSWEGWRRGLFLLLLKACANQAWDKGGIVHDEVTQGGKNGEEKAKEIPSCFFKDRTTI